MKCKNPENCRFGFLGVFLLGLIGITVTAKYYLKKEAVVEREARDHRISAEMQKIGANNVEMTKN